MVLTPLELAIGNMDTEKSLSPGVERRVWREFKQSWCSQEEEGEKRGLSQGVTHPGDPGMASPAPAQLTWFPDQVFTAQLCD